MREKYILKNTGLCLSWLKLNIPTSIRLCRVVVGSRYGCCWYVGSDVRLYVAKLRRRWRLVPSTGPTWCPPLRCLHLPRGTKIYGKTKHNPQSNNIPVTWHRFSFDLLFSWLIRLDWRSIIVLPHFPRAAKSTAPSTSAAARSAPRPNPPLPTNAASIVPVSVFSTLWLYFYFFLFFCTLKKIEKNKNKYKNNRRQ